MLSATSLAAFSSAPAPAPSGGGARARSPREGQGVATPVRGGDAFTVPRPTASAATPPANAAAPNRSGATGAGGAAQSNDGRPLPRGSLLDLAV